MSTFPQPSDWKNPAFVERWKSDQAYSKAKWLERLSREPFILSPYDVAKNSTQGDYEGLITRAHRLESAGGAKPKIGRRSSEQARHQVPAMILYDSKTDRCELHPAVKYATEKKLAKAKRMCAKGLEKKAQREIACGLLGGTQHCFDNGHEFFVKYECGNRYCITCGPKQARKLFARHHCRMFFVAQRLMLCGQENCDECNQALEEKRLPHWPPRSGAPVRIVCAKIDFTMWHDTKENKLPDADRMREMNKFIKRFCRALERKFGISRQQYGLAYCDELGGNNSNPHAHALYVGPYLPQRKKQLSAMWLEITGDSFNISIDNAKDFGEALFHAVKYPAKFAERSTPERLADLEKVFHRVRRFHTLAAFYNPEAPEDDGPGMKRCPICDSPLSEPRGWMLIPELEARGYQDVEKVVQEQKRAKVFGSDHPPP